MDKINSPEQLNKLMKVSKARIWIILVLILLFISFGIYWFVHNDVVISEDHPCYISDEKVALSDFIYDVFYAELGDENLALNILDEAFATYGKEYLNKKIYPAIIYVSDISTTELLEQMPIEVIGLKGSVFHIPTATLDCSEFVKGASFTDKEMREVGMNPGVDYYPILVGLAENQEIKFSAGLYNATVILEVLKPLSLFINK